MADIEEGIRKILLRAKSFDGKVIVLHSGNIGEATFFPLYLRPLFSNRSYRVRSIYQKIVSEQGADYVDLLGSPISATLKEDSARYYANDRLHLSSDGYGLWMQEIRKYLPK